MKHPGWLLFIVLVGCGEARPSEQELVTATGSQVDPLYVKTSVLWTPVNTLRPLYVCWKNPPAWSAMQRSWVEDAIASSWAYFGEMDLNWSICPNSSYLNYDLIIAIRDTAEPPQTNCLGAECFANNPGMFLNFSFVNWGQACQNQLYTDTCIRNIAVHEFGHWLGFSHEQNRSDTPDPTHCMQCARDSDCPSGACTGGWCTNPRQGPNGDTFFGAWDPNSVMNYCNPWYVNSRVYLSTTDKDGVQYYYGVNHRYRAAWLASVEAAAL